jgi:putative copper resistance protein D
VSAPSIPQLLVSGWHVPWTLAGEAVLAAALYLWGATRVRRGWPVWRVLSFLGALLAVLVALGSGLDGYDDRLLSVHMVQHLLLLEVAPILLLVARPVVLALVVLPAPVRRRPAAWLVALRAWTGPLVCLGVYSAVVLATHLPGFYDATLRSPLLHDAEHLTYLAAGTLLWWPVLGGDPAPSRRLNGALQLLYVIAAMLPMEALGAYLSRSPTLVYPAYAAPARELSVPAIIDQQHAGAIMWVLGGVVMVVVVLWSAMRAMAAEERHQQARDRVQLRGSR